MTTDDPIAAEDAKKDLEVVIDHILNGTRDPELMRRACERMDRMREELRKRIGTVEIAVDLIREARDS